MRKALGRIIRRGGRSILFRLIDLIGCWRYPYHRDVADGSGGMRARLYWHYKTTRPVVRGERGAGLEDYFREALHHAQLSLPADAPEIGDVSLSAVGDLMRADGLEDSTNWLYADVNELIFDADVSFANLESNVLNIGDAERGLHVHVDDAGFHNLIGHEIAQYDVVSTANNHILDGGIDGIRNVHRQLDEHGIAYAGTSATQADTPRVAIVDRQGIRIGIVAATYGVNKPQLLQRQPNLVNVLPTVRDKTDTDLRQITQQIERCRRSGCYFVVVSLHWGHEFEFYPRRYQVNVAHRLAEAGADAILGHHSHTIQPFEIYQTQRDTERTVPVFYGLGNLTSWSDAAFRCLSLIARLNLRLLDRPNGQKVLVSGVNVTPALQVRERRNGRSAIRILTLSDAIAGASDSDQTAFVEDGRDYARLLLEDRWVDGGTIRIGACN